jgi:Arc/MetJ-type ribon-helix-helix transcriptional regulator
MSTQNQRQEKLRDYLRAAEMDSILGGVGATLHCFITLSIRLLYAKGWYKSHGNTDATRRSLVTHETEEDVTKLGDAQCIDLAQRIENKERRNVECPKNTEVVYFAEQLEKRVLSNSGGTYQLQMRLEPDTYNILLNLKERADAESFGELIRFALREYERALYEYDLIEDADGSPLHYGSRYGYKNDLPGKAALGANQGSDGLDFHPVSKTRRLNATLSQAAYARMRRLMEFTKASSQSDVVRVALCVLDAKLEKDKMIEEALCNEDPPKEKLARSK